VHDHVAGPPVFYVADNSNPLIAALSATLIAFAVQTLLLIDPAAQSRNSG
jgi:hypothetical protein